MSQTFVNITSTSFSGATKISGVGTEFFGLVIFARNSGIGTSFWATVGF